MAALMGKDGLLSWSGLAWKIHSWTYSENSPAFDDTGANATVREYAFGDPTGTGTIEISLRDDSAAAKKLPRTGRLTGATIADAVMTTVSGTTYTSDITITGVQYAVEKRGGGPPQRVRCTFVTQDTATGSLLNPS